MENTDILKPQKIDALDVIFPTNVMHLMPPYKEIPDEFRQGRTKWNQFFNTMFFSGITGLELIPVEGIDKQMAWMHIRAISGSWELKHEHKEAAVAYLMSLWFKDLKYKPAKREGDKT